jgi:hypothetical protein
MDEYGNGLTETDIEHLNGWCEESSRTVRQDGNNHVWINYTWSFTTKKVPTPMEQMATLRFWKELEGTQGVHFNMVDATVRWGERLSIDTYNGLLMKEQSGWAEPFGKTVEQ